MEKINNKNGFSAVELMITLIIAAIIIIAGYQLYITILQQNNKAATFSSASDLAYSNVRRFSSKPSFPCDSTTDMTQSSGQPLTGFVVYSKTSNDSTTLPNPVVETVKAYAPRGCDAQSPAKIESIVEYGSSPSSKVVVGTYVKPQN